MDVILFGGSFNPPHIGHRHVITTIQKTFPKAKLYICPNYVSPFKLNEKKFTKEEIWSLCLTEFHSYLSKNIVLWDEEIKKETISFTIDSILKLKTVEPNASISLAIGEDNLEKFNEWKSYREIVENIAYIIVIRRKTKYPDPIVCPDTIDKKKFKVLDNPIVMKSSSELRNQFGKDWLDDSVLPETKSLLFSLLNQKGKGNGKIPL